MSDLNAAEIDRILEIAPGQVLDVDGYQFLDKDKKLTLFETPVPKPLTVTTLTGFTDLLEARFEAFASDETLIHVAAHDLVQLVEKTSDRFGRRQVYIEARAQRAEREFKFNDYMPQENFIIGLRSMFVPGPGVDELVKLSGNLAMKASVRQEDDGFTQRVTAKAGIAKMSESTVKPRVTLAPFRTFREIVQPESEYIFRVKGSEDTPTACALFEADGGTWKLEAIRLVKEWLSNRLNGGTDDVLKLIPVIA